MKPIQQKMITLSMITILSLGTVILSLLFVFPTKDTREETRMVYNAMRESYNALAYDDRSLAGGADVSLDGEDLKLLNVRNGRSGANFTEEEIRRLKVLRTRFPENRLIPRVKSEEERRKEAAEVAQLEAMKKRFARKTASRADIDVYFDRQLDTVNDWVQLLEFVVQDENWSPGIKEKYSLMLAHAPRLRDRIEKQRNQMLELNGF